MYMLLPIYSIANLNIVIWGTREEPKDIGKKILDFKIFRKFK